MTFTPKQRMLNAYRGLPSDLTPVAPEFWCYYPAKLLGLDMIEFERIPHWQALQHTFRHYGCEGWGVAGAFSHNPAVTAGPSKTEQLSATQFRETRTTIIRGKSFTSASMLDKNEPRWTVGWPVTDEADLPLWVDAILSADTTFDFTPCAEAWRTVGDDYLLELWLGDPFTDFLAGLMGFERAMTYLVSAEESLLDRFLAKYTEFKIEFVKQACVSTPFESLFIGNAYANNSLLGPRLWRRWDKPFIRTLCDEVHRHGRLLHIHFHGRCMETVPDFAEIGIDCVCPFERPPGGDVSGAEGLQQARRELARKVTFNGNVHTVETLIRGGPEDVRVEVDQIQQAFAGEPRVIIGTGDQVGRETPEENIAAMIEQARR